MIGTLHTHDGRAFALEKCGDGFIFEEFDVSSFPPEEDMMMEEEMTEDEMMEDEMMEDGLMRNSLREGLKNHGGVQQTRSILFVSKKRGVLNAF